MAKKVRVNKDVCVGCGCCNGIAPELFDFGDDGLAECIVSEVPADLEDACNDAIAGCPVQAIEEE